MPHSPKSCATFPYLLILASILMLIFGFSNGVDVFYFGLLKSDALAFIIGFTMTSVFTFFIAFRQMHPLIRLLLILLALMVLAATFYLAKGLINTSELAIKPTVGAGLNRAEDFFSYLAVGWFFGGLVGKGTGSWIKKLRGTNLPNKLSTTIPLLAALMVSIAVINTFFLGNIFLTLGSTLAAIYIAISATYVSQENA